MVTTTTPITPTDRDGWKRLAELDRQQDFRLPIKSPAQWIYDTLEFADSYEQLWRMGGPFTKLALDEYLSIIPTHTGIVVTLDMILETPFYGENQGSTYVERIESLTKNTMLGFLCAVTRGYALDPEMKLEYLEKSAQMLKADADRLFLSLWQRCVEAMPAYMGLKHSATMRQFIHILTIDMVDVLSDTLTGPQNFSRTISELLDRLRLFFLIVMCDHPILSVTNDFETFDYNMALAYVEHQYPKSHRTYTDPNERLSRGKHSTDSMWLALDESLNNRLPNPVFGNVSEMIEAQINARQNQRMIEEENTPSPKEYTNEQEAVEH